METMEGGDWEEERVRRDLLKSNLLDGEEGAEKVLERITWW